MRRNSRSFTNSITSLGNSITGRRGSANVPSVFEAMSPTNLGLGTVASAHVKGSLDEHIEWEHLETALPHEGFSAKNVEWNNIQQAVIALFQGKKPSADEMNMLCESIQDMTESDIGPFIYDYYKNHMLKRAMAILYKKLELDSGDDAFLESLSDVWIMFYTDVMPFLSIIMKPVRTPNANVHCRRTAVVAFRDRVVLKSPLEDVLAKGRAEVPPRVTQMLLVLQYARDSDPPNEDFLRLESILARVVSPLLGYKGIFMGGPEPVVKSNYTTQTKLVVSGADYPGRPRVGSLPVTTKVVHRRQTSLSPSMLETVEEHATGHSPGRRRHTFHPDEASDRSRTDPRRHTITEESPTQSIDRLTDSNIKFY